MTSAVAALVAAGLAVAVLFALARGLDAPAAAMLLVLVVLGALGIAVARRGERGQVGPARCPECDGLISPTAPYCKHCGASVA